MDIIFYIRIEWYIINIFNHFKKYKDKSNSDRYSIFDPLVYVLFKSNIIQFHINTLYIYYNKFYYNHRLYRQSCTYMLFRVT